MPTEIDALIREINKKQQEEVLVRGADLRHVTYQRATTGALAFDLMLGGGWPLNCWNEVIGNESAGKTAIVLKTIAANEALNPDYHTLWVAAEEFDPEWAEALGANLDNFTFVLTNVMENAYDAVLSILDERAVDAVVIDSYPALVPSEEDDKTMMELTVGRGAYMTNKFMRKSMAVQRRSLVSPDRPCLAILINQWRERIGVMYGDPRTTPGGKGKNYRFLTRVEVAREEWITDSGKNKIGQMIKCRTVKNKTAPPQRTAVVPFYFDDYKDHAKGSYGIVQQVHAIAIDKGIIEQRGAWYYFGDRKWQGEKGVLAALQTEPLLLNDVQAQVRHLVLGEPLPPPTEAPRKKRSISRSK